MIEKPLNKIMVIEDEADILTIVKFALERLGHFTVEYCNSGKNAIQQAKAFSPDLIIMDMMMPEMDGITVFKEIRKDRELSHIPIIFMTARVQPEEVKNYFKIGAIGVITKPFDPLTLPEKLNTIWREQDKESKNG